MGQGGAGQAPRSRTRLPRGIRVGHHPPLRRISDRGSGGFGSSSESGAAGGGSGQGPGRTGWGGGGQGKAMTYELGGPPVQIDIPSLHRAKDCYRRTKCW